MSDPELFPPELLGRCGWRLWQAETGGRGPYTKEIVQRTEEGASAVLRESGHKELVEALERARVQLQLDPEAYHTELTAEIEAALCKAGAPNE